MSYGTVEHEKASNNAELWKVPQGHTCKRFAITSEVLTNLSNNFAAYAPQFPALIPVVRALTTAATDPTKNFEAAEAPAKKVKPVNISYEGESILVRNTPYTDKALRRGLAAFVRGRGARARLGAAP